MAHQRLALNLYLLKPDASPATAAPAGRTTTQLERKADTLESVEQLADTDKASSDPDDGERGWIETWVVEETLVASALPIQRNNQASLLVRATPGSPSWLSVLGALAPETPGATGQLNFGALFFQPIGNEMVVWSFGNGWMLIEPATTVDRFGLRSGLNALLSSPLVAGQAFGIRELTSSVRASVIRRSTVSTARPSNPSSIERIDRSSDGATMAALTTRHRLFGRVDAGRSLRFEAPVGSVRDLTRYAVQAIRLHRRTDYQSNDDYKWIDFTVPVSDPAEIDSVLDALWEQSCANDPPPIDALWAETDPATETAPLTVRFPLERQTAERTTLTWDLARLWLVGQSLEGSAALKTSLRFFEDSAKPAVVVAPLWWHLVAQIETGGSTYVISDGEIWKASAEYLSDLNQTLSTSTIVNPPQLPRYALGESEDSYNNRAAIHGSHLLIDKSLLYLTGQSSIEAGDLLSAAGHLMHVKRRSRSSTMSHAAAQALSAAKLLRSSAEARSKLDEMLTSAAPPPTGLQDMRDHCSSFGGQITATVQIVFVGDWRGEPDVSRLPLLTRLNLAGWLGEMPCNREIVLVGTDPSDYPA